ncbi:acyl-CoA thioesterase [Microbulbifer hydrolyticus]|uniref:Acyl-CoA thioester hydrolase n=1 Tax=Microbulbifer hydrolyticus TaxID=48074 RepID=A0A6P1T6L5_9GAMM|nr:thioesterase family protein [Microbulbifer hydrolyticus]MBB5211596.1 acyl-CoA thioester hydrolase [Microbulbifer hydrolyticus]QHQ37667.1 acyl-CoA thioesterase [Microbulbifer hydrolyticus]
MFTYQVEPRFSETDALGHINNTVVPVWFEQGRTPIFALFNPDLALDKWNLILKKMDVDFVAQIYLYSPVEIRTSLSAVGNTSMTIHQEVWQKDRLVAQGDCVMVHFDYQQQAKAPIPPEVKEKLLQHLA